MTIALLILLAVALPVGAGIGIWAYERWHDCVDQSLYLCLKEIREDIDGEWCFLTERTKENIESALKRRERTVHR